MTLAGIRCIAVTPPLERFWPKVQKTDCCWEWTGYVMPNGYGTFGRGRAIEGKVYAHRFAYEALVGPIPVGQHVCHRCDNRRCVRPDHLFLGTQRDNMRDMVAKGRKRVWNRDIAACKRGHAFTEANTRHANGKRICRTCARDHMRRRREMET